MLVDSELINKNIALKLMRWIDEPIDDKIPIGFGYYFKFLFRSNNSDGPSFEKFHKKCDNKGATIVVAKISNSNKLVGGYNPLDWKGDNEWKQTTDSFLFRFELDSCRMKAKVSRISNHASGFAICCNSDEPSFGEGPDLHFSDSINILKSKTKFYSKILSVSSLKFSYYEVFQVVRSFTESFTQG
ncbi:1268_t:CDS:1 [Dentiscutata heterogama]|uniref:1268_t:CDS:1 n=1 Tax=Dentiscutata heterogama TaxID=1316150 RepID=A0ACA9KC24_9GLOM|nr:1268_t:CDS:1 [Dentiscutata heterogama]